MDLNGKSSEGLLNVYKSSSEGEALIVSSPVAISSSWDDPNYAYASFFNSKGGTLWQFLFIGEVGQSSILTIWLFWLCAVKIKRRIRYQGKVQDLQVELRMRLFKGSSKE